MLQASWEDDGEGASEVIKTLTLVTEGGLSDSALPTCHLSGGKGAQTMMALDHFYFPHPQGVGLAISEAS